MLKPYFTSFDTEALYESFKLSEEFIKPNVSLISSLKKLMYTKDNGEVKQFITINGTTYTDKVITLAAGGSYIISGVHEGQIVIDAKSVKPEDNTYITLDGATIISDEAFGILYDTPEDNKGYKDLVVTIAKNSRNHIVCTKEIVEDGDLQLGALSSSNNLTVQGVGYLSVYNKIGHGVRGTNLNVAGVHLYTDVAHDGVHGKNVYLLDGVFYFANAKDAVGTNEDGKIYLFGGEFYKDNVLEDLFDAKKGGYYAFTKGIKLNGKQIDDTAVSKLSPLEGSGEEGTVVAYPTSADYKAGTNGVVITPTTTAIYEQTYYNADEEGNIVASATYAGNTVLEQGDLLIPEQSVYVIGKEYNVVEVTGHIIYPIVRPMEAVTFTEPVFSKKGKLNGGYENKFDVYLNGAVIVTEGNAPSIANLPDVGRVKVTAVKDTLNAVYNKFDETTLEEGIINADHDAIKSENNLTVEVKNNAYLYVTSLFGDGVDGGDTKFTDSKGVFVVNNCGQRGVKGNAIVIGPDATVDSSVISAYITDTTSVDYTTFDGIFVAKNNVKNHEVGLAFATAEDPDQKKSGFADVYGRNGKASKGQFGTTDAELKGVAIIGSLGGVVKVDTGNAKNLYVNEILKNTALSVVNEVTLTVEDAIVAPYKAEEITE